MIPLWLAFALAAVIGGSIIWWAYNELAKGVKHL